MLAVLALLLLPAAAVAQTAALPPNPFADFSAFMLPNGLRVWYRQLPGAGTATVTLAVPHGESADPPGEEGTAHLLEHALFHDRNGRTEAELARAIQARGGSFNASTGFDRTVYYLSIGSDDTAYGIEWLYGVLAPRAFTDAGVARSREPVAIETAVRPRSAVERLAAWYVNQPRLRPPSFWQREFGLHVRDDRDIDAYRSLHAISAADLQAFYDTYYTPPEMTLLVVSDRPLAAMQRTLHESFGTLPWRPAAPPGASAVPRNGATRRYFWGDVANTELAVRFRVRSPDAADHVRLIFLGDLLERRLFERLRLVDEPAVYGVSARTTLQRGAALFSVTAVVRRDREAAARAVVEEELARLRASGDTAAFYRDREALARQVRLQNGTPAALQQWMLSSFHDPSMHSTFPDLGAYYATVGPDSVAAFAQRLFVDDNRIESITRPLPLSPALLAVIAALLTLAAVRLYRRIAYVPADMSRVRFIGRLRGAPALRLLALLLFAAGAAVVLRLLVAAAHVASDRWLVGIDNFFVQYAPAAVALCALPFGTLWLVGMVPAKVLVFDDHLRLKSRTYRSRVVGARELRGVELLSSGTVKLLLADGGRLLLRVRDPLALQRALEPLVTPPPVALPLPEGAAAGA